MRLLLAFALSILLWWLLTDDDSPRPDNDGPADPDRSEPATSARRDPKSARRTPGLLGLQRLPAASQRLKRALKNAYRIAKSRISSSLRTRNR